MYKKIVRKNPVSQPLSVRAKQILEHSVYASPTSEDHETFEEALGTLSLVKDMKDHPYKMAATKADALLTALRAIAKNRPHIAISKDTKKAITDAPELIAAMKERTQAFIDDPETRRADKNRSIKSLENLDTIGALLDSLHQEISRTNNPPPLEL